MEYDTHVERYTGEQTNIILHIFAVISFTFYYFTSAAYFVMWRVFLYALLVI